MRNIPHKNFLQKVRKTVLRLNVAIFFADSKLSPPLNYLKNCLANKTTSWNVRRNQFPMSNCGPIWAKLSNIKAKVEMLIKLPNTHKKSLGLNYVTWKVEVCKAVWIIKNFLSLRINAKRTYKGSKDIVKIIEIYFQRKKNLVKSTTYLVINLVRMSL